MALLDGRALLDGTALLDAKEVLDRNLEPPVKYHVPVKRYSR